MKTLFFTITHYVFGVLLLSNSINTYAQAATDHSFLASIESFDQNQLPEKVTYNRDIRPILSDNCFGCHGNDKNNRKANLSFANRDDAITPRSDGFVAIKPGNAQASGIFQRITHANPADRMPPKITEKTLTAKQILLVKRWINQGAEYERHWSYNLPVKATLPKVSLPEKTLGKTNNDWTKNPIDRFIMRKHQELALTPSDKADKRTLIRRLTLDLTGLPPSMEEVNDFLNDTSENAYETLVDRLLASPHYGERMAMDWLDVVRYADTWGYHSDNERIVWPYRDYVINAFNNNMPFSQFTKEQLAGDLMPETGYRGLTASTYNMMIQITQEGGAQNKEYLVKSMVDRITNVGTTWLGSTTGCAVCHDHKFDPYSAKDTYSLGAFFADIEEKGFWGSSRVGSAIFNKFPIVFVGSEQERQQFQVLKTQLRKLSGKMPYKISNRNSKEVNIKGKDNSVFGSLNNVKIQKPLPGFDTWLKQLEKSNVEPKSIWQPLVFTKLQVENTQASIVDNHIIKMSWQKPIKNSNFVINAALKPNSKRPNVFNALQLDLLTAKEDPAGEKAFKNSPFAIKNLLVTVTYKNGKQEQAPIDFHAIEQALKPADFSIYYNHKDKIRSDFKYKPEIGTRNSLLGKKVIIYLQKPLVLQADAHLEIKMDLAWRQGIPSIGASSLPSTRINIANLADMGPVPEAVLNLAKKGKKQRNQLDNENLKKYYNVYSQAALNIVRSINQTDFNLIKFGEEHRNTWVTKTRKEPRTTRILPRGDWMDESGEIVQPAIPEFLGKLDTQGKRADRLDLANWLVSDKNPLTARVTVNRFWKKFYGSGLSKVLDDLGSQGEWPTHPELLDWLAVEFIESGWNVKHMVRLMVTSATYQQTSVVDEQHRQQDPYNRYYARQAQVRLPAEIVRDNALKVASLLNTKIGGQSVRPYQPQGFLSDLEFPKRYWEPEQDKKQYRRGLYTFWQRSRLHPMMQSFDAPARSEGHADRVVSNTPLQALILLNDPSFVEAARALAANIMNKPGDIKDKINWALEKTLARPASSMQELDLLNQAYQANLDYFTLNGDEIMPLLTKGQQTIPENVNTTELAAWTSVARIILNLHETVTRF